MTLLVDVFAIDICAYAVMSNHVHTVLHINAAKAHHFTDLEVCERWHRLYKGTVLTQKFARQDSMNKAEQVAVKMRIDQWRLNLFDLSQFMKALNEPIARMANAEDKCTGRFYKRLLPFALDSLLPAEFYNLYPYRLSGQLKLFKNIPDIFVGRPI